MADFGLYFGVYNAEAAIHAAGSIFDKSIFANFAGCDGYIDCNDNDEIVIMLCNIRYTYDVHQTIEQLALDIARELDTRDVKMTVNARVYL